MRVKSLILVCILLVGVFLLTACQKSMKDVSRNVSAVPLDSIQVGLVPFTQPTTTSELITGHIPQNQGIISATALPELDHMLRTALRKDNRVITLLSKPLNLKISDYHESEIPQALPFWLRYGKEYKVDFLLVPQILNWHQREGSRAGVTKAAHVRAEFFLLDIRQERIFRRSVFDVEQEGLIDNILNVGDFFQRGGGWVTAEELTQEAIAKAVKDLGL